jgi:hypothetical protein
VRRGELERRFGERGWRGKLRFELRDCRFELRSHRVEFGVRLGCFRVEFQLRNHRVELGLRCEQFGTGGQFGWQ